MIFGIGTDIVQCSRFVSWINNEKKCKSFFHETEIPDINFSQQQKLEHLASRFAVKEAFVKAMGTGFKNFKYNEIFVEKDTNGKPILKVTGAAKQFLEELVLDYSLHLTISHEKDYAVAFVIIENNSK